MKLLQEPETALPECCGENVSCLCRVLDFSTAWTDRGKTLGPTASFALRVTAQ
jgi:hypothetical protein